MENIRMTAICNMVPWFLSLAARSEMTMIRILSWTANLQICALVLLAIGGKVRDGKDTASADQAGHFSGRSFF